MLYRAHLTWVGYKLATLVVIGTDCIGICKSNYHTITTKMALHKWRSESTIYQLSDKINVKTTFVFIFKYYYFITITTIEVLLRWNNVIISQIGQRHRHFYHQGWKGKACCCTMLKLPWENTNTLVNSDKWCILLFWFM